VPDGALGGLERRHVERAGRYGAGEGGAEAAVETAEAVEGEDGAHGGGGGLRGRRHLEVRLDDDGRVERGGDD
jgi:hypothetical protein